MTDRVRPFILKQITKKAPLPAGVDVDAFDYIASGHVDSIAIMKFVVDLESHFDIEISDADLTAPEFRTVGGLAGLVTRKIAAKG